MRKKTDDIDTAMVEGAAYFTASIFLGRGKYETEDHPSLEIAREAAIRLKAAAQNGRRGMVYAVSPQGRSTLVPDAYRPGTTAEAAPPKPTASKPAPGKRAAILEAVQRGELPPAPDFSAETHKRFRPKLAQVVALAEAGDIAGLKAFEINPVSSSPKAIAKYRDLAVIALEVRQARTAA